MADLSARQQRALRALLTEPNIRAAAIASRTPERTLYRWLTDSAFRAAYRECSRRLLEDATGRLRAAAGEAVETLRTALKAEHDSVKVRAAVAILEVAIKTDMDDLAARVAALEQTREAAQRWT